MPEPHQPGQDALTDLLTSLPPPSLIGDVSFGPGHRAQREPGLFFLREDAMKIHRTLTQAIELLEAKLYSCDAVQFACHNRNHFEKCKDFLRELGVAPSGFYEFDDVEFEHRQFARALWLTWAAMIAKEWNL